MFSGGTVLPDSKETELGSSNQEASQSAGKNTGIVLVPCLLMEVAPYSYFWWSGYFSGPWMSFVMTDEFSGCCELQPTLLFLTFLSLMNYGHIIKILGFQMFEAFVRIFFNVNLWGNGLVVKALESQSRGPVFKTSEWLQGQFSLSSF